MNRRVIPNNIDWPLCPLPPGPKSLGRLPLRQLPDCALHAENSEIRDLLIFCTECGAHNSMDDAIWLQSAARGTNPAAVGGLAFPASHHLVAVVFQPFFILGKSAPGMLGLPKQFDVGR